MKGRLRRGLGMGAVWTNYRTPNPFAVPPGLWPLPHVQGLFSPHFVYEFEVMRGGWAWPPGVAAGRDPLAQGHWAQCPRVPIGTGSGGGYLVTDEGVKLHDAVAEGAVSVEDPDLRAGEGGEVPLAEPSEG